MRYFLATVSDRALGNWAICRRESLWGTRRGASRAKHAAELVEDGDRIVVWRSGTEHGVIALAEAVGSASEVVSMETVPWPDPETYEFLIPIRVVREYSSLVRDEVQESGPPSRTGRFRVSSDKAQSGFVLIGQDDQAFEPLRTLFEPEPDERAIELPGTEQERRREPVSAVLLRPTGSVPEALLHLMENLPDDPTVEVLIVGDEPDGRAVEAELASGRFPELESRLTFLTREGLARRLATTD